MFRKNYLTVLFFTALFAFGGFSVFAQNAPISGRVEVTNADGTKTPVVGALVEIFRLDQKIKLPTDKTDKKGNFAFAGITLGGKYVLAVSGEGIAPAILPNISPGMDNVSIPVVPGDGKRWTEDEVKQQLNSRTTTTNTNTTSQTKDNSEEVKKREEEIKRQNEENEKIKKSNEIITASQKEGNAAFEAKNYDLAITKYEEGYNAAPTFVPAASVFLNNMSSALIKRAGINFNAKKDSDRMGAQNALKDDTNKAVEATNKVLEMLKTATPRDEKQKMDFEKQRILALRNRKEAYYLMVKFGSEYSKNQEVATAFEEYFAVETVATEKLAARLSLGEILLAGDPDKALSVYETILTESPNNPDALREAGYALIAIGYNNGEDKTKFQMGANYLQKFIDAAPSHPKVADAKETLNTLKTSYKITPQKEKK